MVIQIGRSPSCCPSVNPPPYEIDFASCSTTAGSSPEMSSHLGNFRNSAVSSRNWEVITTCGVLRRVSSYAWARDVSKAESRKAKAGNLYIDPSALRRDTMG